MSSPSLREIGREQGAAGTTIDGNRLSLMLRWLAQRWNNVPRRNLKRVWVPQTVVGGYTPQELASGVQDQLPWLGGYNSDKQRVGNAHSEGYQNPWRSKGNVVSGIDPTDPATASVDDLLTWSTALYFRRPVRITGLFLGLIVDNNYGNDFQFGSQPPPGKTNNASVDDWTVTLEIDDPNAREERSLSSISFKRAQNIASAWQFSNIQPLVPGADMQPAHPGGHLNSANSWDSLFLVDQNINPELPRDTRCRLNITIPKYEPDDYWAGWNNNGVNAEVWQNQAYSWTLHFAEALEE